MNAISISNVAIRQTENLYNLNDLHKAAGKEKRHQPSNWLATQQAVELIKELQAPEIQGAKQNQQVIQVKNGIGTFVCKELVIHYAMWISAKFSLQVIQTFLNTVSGSPKLTPEQKQQIQAAVNHRVHRTGETHQTIYRAIHALANVNSYHEINAADFDRVMAYLADDIQAAPTPYEINEELVIANAYLLLHAQNMRLFVKRYLPAFECFNIENKAALWSYVHETENFFKIVRAQLNLALPLLTSPLALMNNPDYLQRQIQATAK